MLIIFMIYANYTSQKKNSIKKEENNKKILYQQKILINSISIL